MVIKEKDMGLGKSSMGTHVLNCTEKDCPCLHPRKEARMAWKMGKWWISGAQGGNCYHVISIIKGRGVANGNEKKEVTSKCQVFLQQWPFRENSAMWDHPCFTEVLESSDVGGNKHWIDRWIEDTKGKPKDEEAKKRNLEKLLKFGFTCHFLEEAIVKMKRREGREEGTEEGRTGSGGGGQREKGKRKNACIHAAFHN